MPLQLLDAPAELFQLLRLRLVGVAIVARLRLLLPQRRIAVAAGRGDEQRNEGDPHCTRLSRSSISGAGKNPVTVARAESGHAKVEDAPAVAAPRAGLLRRIRRAVGLVPFYRAFVAVEFSLLALAAAIVDTTAGDQIGSRVLVIALLPVGAVTLVGHLVAILSSDRLR